MSLIPLLAQEAPISGEVLKDQLLKELTGYKSTMAKFFQENGLELTKNLILAIVIFYVGKTLALVTTRIVTRVLERANVDVTLVRFVCNIMYYVLLGIVVMASLEKLGVQTTSLAAVLAAAGFAIGMALQGSLGNFAAGVMLIIFRPFKVGDSIEAGGTSGCVEEISIFHTIMKTSDNRRVIVPNSSITGGNITNNSHSPTRRIDLTIGCTYSDDLLAVKSFLQQLVDQEPRIQRKPAPSVGVSELAECGVRFSVQSWVRASDYGAVYQSLIERIKLGFDERGFHFPLPTRQVYTHSGEVPQHESVRHVGELRRAS